MLRSGRGYWNTRRSTHACASVRTPMKITVADNTHIVRETLKQLKKDYEKSEDDLKALQSVGQIIGEVLKQLDEERCNTKQTLSKLLQSS